MSGGGPARRRGAASVMVPITILASAVSEGAGTYVRIAALLLLNLSFVQDGDRFCLMRSYRCHFDR
jgi:hypothetical protein